MRPGHLRQGTLRHGVFTGALAAAATAGALLGFGLRQGTPARPFNAVAALLLGDQAESIWGFHSVVTVVGVLVHVALAVGWGLLFATVARGKRGLRLAGTAFLVALAALGVNLLLAMRVVGSGVSDVFAPAQVIALHVLLGVTLGVGMRLATSDLWSD